MSKENSLFKEATIKRLISNIKITAKHKKAVNKWLGYLKGGKLQHEKQAYIEFANTILRDLLGYDISLEGLKHEEENIEFLFKKNGNNLICFEAKGAKTKNLWAYQGRTKKSRETPVDQINSYMYDKIIPFGILTNYRLFVLFDRNEGSKKYHLIDFTELTKEEKLKEFIALFSREHVENGFITEVIQQSIVEEREFTKEFYKLYHETRLMLIKEFEDNSGISRETSVHFAQLYLNRLMFVFFAEDTGKIDKRIIEDRIIQTLDNIHLFSSNSSNISNILVGLFNDLDKGSDFPVKLFGFNGGLFKHPIPPKIFFKDFRDEKFFKNVNQYSKLKKKELELDENEKVIFNKYKNKLNPIIRNILLMASFDFNSEVNVNILGHIFEQSISDIEDLKTDKSSRRKKEGIFYTPEYITDYICRNTIITYLSKKGSNSIPKLIKGYAENIEELEEKFKSIKILDPACGSGAFLIKATDIMLEIFKAIQEFKQSEGKYEAKKGLKKKNVKGQFTLSKWNEEEEAREIIENSIHGVDINEESVEITKLSLFLKMARKNRKLTNLSNNIKKGNSLINDPNIAGDLAFDWDKEFPFKFDIVIGNPPYVSNKEIKKKDKVFFNSNYKTAVKQYDLYSLFIEKSYNLLKNKSYFGFIIPESLLGRSSFESTRKLLLKNVNITQIHQIKGVFDDPVVSNILLLYSKQKTTDNQIYFTKSKQLSDFVDKKFKYIKTNQKEYLNNKNNKIIFMNKENKEVIKKINKGSLLLGNIIKIHRGEEIGKNSDKLLLSKNSNTKQILFGENIQRYYTKLSKKYIDLENIKKNKEIYSLPKIMIRQLGNKINANIDDDNHFVTTQTVYNLSVKNTKFNLKYITTTLNSNLISFYYNIIFKEKDLFPRILLENILELPIKIISLSEQKPFIEKADLMLKLNKEFYEKKTKFFNRIKKSFNLEKINKKLDKFYDLEFNDFITEIEKQSKNKVSLKEQDEWEDYFNDHKKDLLILKDKIEKTDREINKMVYKLYGLSKAEIQIVEGSLK